MADPIPGNNKAIAAGASGALMIIVCWAVETFAHIQIPSEVATAATTLVSTAMVYLIPHGGN